MVNLKPVVVSALQNDAQLTNLLGTDANGNKKIYFHAPTVDVSGLGKWITYYFADDADALIADDRAQAQEIEVSIDIWSTGSTTAIYERVDAVIKGLAYPVRRIAAIDLYEKDAKIYHKHVVYQFEVR